VATTCSKCGQPHLDRFGHPSCNGHVGFDRDSYVKGQERKRLDRPRPCRKPRPKGAVDGWVCKMHGGASEHVRRGQERRAAVQAITADAQALLAAEGIDGIDDPITEIGRLAQEALALKTAAGARANALTDIRYTGALQRDEDGGLVGTGTEQLRAEVALYERALDRSMKFLEVVAKHAVSRPGIDNANTLLRQLATQLGLDDRD
jgi:hypothetical protein